MQIYGGFVLKESFTQMRLCKTSTLKKSWYYSKLFRLNQELTAYCYCNFALLCD